MKRSKQSNSLDIALLTLLVLALIGLPTLTSRAQEQSGEPQAVRERVFAGGRRFRR